MSAATAFRVGRLYARTVRNNTSKLFELWLDACDPEPEAEARKKFREEVIKVASDYTTSACKDVQKGLDDVDGFAASRKERKEKEEAAAGKDPGATARIADLR